MSDDPSRPIPTSAGDVPRPELTPESFLRTVVAPSFAEQIRVLRAKIATLEEQVREWEDAQASIEVRVSGDGGGIWYLNVGNGRMEIASAPSSAVLFSIRQTAEDWRALATRRSMLGGGSADPSGQRGVLTRSRIARLRAISGTVRLVLKGEDGKQERHITLHFGPDKPADPPQTTVVLREADAQRLRDGTLEPQAAFLQGLVTISGDMGIAVQVGTALFL